MPGGKEPMSSLKISCRSLWFNRAQSPPLKVPRKLLCRWNPGPVVFVGKFQLVAQGWVLRQCRSCGVRREVMLFQIRMDCFGRDMSRNPGSGTLLFPALQSFGPPALLLTPFLPLKSSSGSLVFTLVPQSCWTSPPTWEAGGNKKALCFPENGQSPMA